MTTAHPWTIAADAGDDTADVGDSRDMTLPEPRARGGMTVVDRSAWLAAINAAVNAEGGPSRAVLQAADRIGLRMERMVDQSVWSSPENAFVSYTDIDDETATILRNHWVYGERFWAVWQGRQKPAASAPKPERPRLRDSCEPQVAQGLRGLVFHHGHGAYTPGADPDPRPVLTLADGSTVRADEVWEGDEGGGCEPVARAGDESFGRSCAPGSAWVRLRTQPWRLCGDAWKTTRHRVYPPAEAKPTALAAPPGCDPGGPARNVPIRVGDYVRAICTPLLRVVAVRGSEVTAVDAAQPLYGYMMQAGAVTEHRAAPRIVLPDGREVVPDRMWHSTSAAHTADAYANVGKSSFYRTRRTGAWVFNGAPWSDELLAASAARYWPPA